MLEIPSDLEPEDLNAYLLGYLIHEIKHRATAMRVYSSMVRLYLEQNKPHSDEISLPSPQEEWSDPILQMLSDSNTKIPYEFIVEAAKTLSRQAKELERIALEIHNM